jgi:hypothetical protein
MPVQKIIVPVMSTRRRSGAAHELEALMKDDAMELHLTAAEHAVR